MIVDGVRLLLIAGSLWLIWLCVMRAFEAFVWGQRARLAGFALALMIVSGDQIERIGEPGLSWRAIPHLVLIVVGLWGLLKFDPLSEETT